MSKRNKIYFMKPGNNQTLFRIDKSKPMNEIVNANWKQIQADFDRQIKVHNDMVRATQSKTKFTPLPIQLVLSIGEMKKLCKEIGIPSSDGPIRVFYNSEQFHLCSFINEVKAKEIGDAKNEEIRKQEV